MASIFRPPQPARRNDNTPKLRLPSADQSSSSPSPAPLSVPQKAPSSLYSANAINGRVTHTTTTTPVASHHPLSLNTQGDSRSGNGSSMYSTPSLPPLSAKTPGSAGSMTRRRPVPPPLDGIEVHESPSMRARPPPSVALPVPTPVSQGASDIAKSMRGLSINTAAVRQEDAASAAADTPVSQDSYLSNLLSTYENSASASATPLTATPAGNGNNANGTSGHKPLDVMDLGEDMWHYTHLKDEIVTLGVLGEGAGGSVAKCRLKHGSTIFALKTINVLNTDPEFQKQIFRELQFNRSFKSDYIVRYYGMFTDEQNSSIYIAMEYMGGKSLEAVYKNLLTRGGRLSEKVLGKVAESVLRGLSYLHEKKIIHRDIKPQNILLNEQGEVKLCDFGVSGEAVNSLATTFTGTSFYMAPERIQGQPYSVTCDVWSLGLTILEVAQGHFPFGSDKITANIAPIELLMLILTFEPQLRDEEDLGIRWSSSFKNFIAYCLKKDPMERPSPRQMIRHPWIQGQMKKRVNMQKFIHRCWE